MIVGVAFWGFEYVNDLVYYYYNIRVIYFMIKAQIICI